MTPDDKPPPKPENPEDDVDWVEPDDVSEEEDEPKSGELDENGIPWL